MVGQVVVRKKIFTLGDWKFQGFGTKSLWLHGKVMFFVGKLTIAACDSGNEQENKGGIQEGFMSVLRGVKTLQIELKL